MKHGKSKIPDNCFDVTMGSYDRLEVCELDGALILSTLANSIRKINSGFLSLFIIFIPINTHATLKSSMKHCLAQTGKSEFYSSLSGKGIGEKGYQHFLKVWNIFEMKTMKDYHDLYLKCNVLLLADVFETFRNRCPKTYGLCPRVIISAHHL